MTTDEELAPIGPRRTRRLRAQLAVGAVLLGGAFLVARAVGSDDRTVHPNRSPSSTPSRSYGTGPPDSGSGLLNGMATGGPAATPTLPAPVVGSPAACPAGNRCTTDTVVPAAARAAVRAVFPSARVTACTSVHLGAQLWYRRMEASAGDRRVSIVVRVPEPGEGVRGGVGPAGSRVTTYVEGTQTGRLVRVTVVGRAAEPLDPLSLLVADERLLAPG